jgi:hypothetical protein
MRPEPDPAADILERLREQQDVCGSEPPYELVDAQGRIWEPGDCYCTLPPGHDGGTCYCEICTARHECPGWPTPKETP